VAAERAILLLPGCEHRLSFSPGRLGQARVEPCSSCAAGNGVEPVPLDVELMTRNVTDLDARAAVVAVGSNASPTVMRNKLTRAGCSPVVPMAVGVLGNVAVGHSAHVSVRGYLPAAPMRRPGAATRVVVSFLDETQLRAIDDTERNYDRVILTQARHDVTLVLHERLPGPGGDGPAEQLSEFHIYRSQHGLLRIDGETMFFPRQVQVSGWLAAQRVAPWDRHEPVEASAHLVKDRALRDRAFRTFRDRGLVIDDGLEPAARRLRS
jgi:hypothetical protein